MKEYRTKIKDYIKEYMQLHPDERFCAAEIHEYLKTCSKSVNLTTVYRNLEKMTEAGELAKTKNPQDDCTYFQVLDTARHCEQHLHMRCLRCGKMVHLEDEYMQQFYEYVREKTRFELDCTASLLNGMCKDCIKRNGS
ncbi:Fur family transcriptional regulator [Eubacterium oxidoreducens]|uniref:Fur family transcriptional regulator, ferric uptake regulator n=1 Tax=Eubacterium oxidoreducens TaxID=1732 RepID=A0A1G6CIS5_EUBOX|nr:transcriptional repressor [Eubacterium oxidoreducens]SDB32838.1 Fur family transcriptional regulator, ferric uptake regulator [Eubacterium oxidoreducens]